MNKTNFKDTKVNTISDLFEDPLYTELFNARCHDTGEAANSKENI